MNQNNIEKVETFSKISDFWIFFFNEKQNHFPLWNADSRMNHEKRSPLFRIDVKSSICRFDDLLYTVFINFIRDFLHFSEKNCISKKNQTIEIISVDSPDFYRKLCTESFLFSRLKRSTTTQLTLYKYWICWSLFSCELWNYTTLISLNLKLVEVSAK